MVCNAFDIGFAHLPAVDRTAPDAQRSKCPIELRRAVDTGQSTTSTAPLRNPQVARPSSIYT
jgi:hypothetical protein